MGVPGEERDKGAERVFREITAENFANLMKDISINIQEAQQTPGKNEFKGIHTETHYNQTFKSQSQRGKPESSKREENHHIHGILSKMISVFQSETLATRRQWTDIVKLIKEKNCQPRILIWQNCLSKGGRSQAIPRNSYTVHGILQARILVSLSLFQGVFPAQGSNPDFPYCGRIVYRLSHKEAQEYWSG